MSNMVNVKWLNDKSKNTPRFLKYLIKLEGMKFNYLSICSFCNSGTSYEMPRFYY